MLKSLEMSYKASENGMGIPLNVAIMLTIPKAIVCPLGSWKGSTTTPYWIPHRDSNATEMFIPYGGAFLWPHDNLLLGDEMGV